MRTIRSYELVLDRKFHRVAEQLKLCGASFRVENVAKPFFRVTKVATVAREAAPVKPQSKRSDCSSRLALCTAFSGSKGGISLMH